MIRKIIIILNSIFYLFISIGCSKEIVELDTIPKIIWKANLGPRPSDQLSQQPFIYRDKVIFGYQVTGLIEGYYIYDKTNGSLIKDIMNQASFDQTSVLYKNLYVSKIGVWLRSINLDNFEIRSQRIDSADWTFPNLTLIDDVLYFPRDGRNKYNPKENQYNIVGCDLNKGLRNFTFVRRSFNEEEGVLGSTSSAITKIKNQDGDEIIFHGASKGFWKVGKKSKYRLEAYNTTKNEIIWETPEFEIEAESFGTIGHHPIIDKCNVLFNISGQHLYCLDANTGKIKWITKGFEVGGLMTLYNGKITILNKSGDLMNIDSENGIVLSKKNIGPSSIKNICLHKGVLYFANVNNLLYAVDADTHAILWETKSPNSCSYCTYGFAYTVVDPETNRLYISDGKEVICYQLK